MLYIEKYALLRIVVLLEIFHFNVHLTSIQLLEIIDEGGELNKMGMFQNVKICPDHIVKRKRIKIWRDLFETVIFYFAEKLGEGTL